MEGGQIYVTQNKIVVSPDTVDIPIKLNRATRAKALPFLELFIVSPCFHTEIQTITHIILGFFNSTFFYSEIRTRMYSNCKNSDLSLNDHM